MDPRLTHLIREDIDSFVKWDILKFFRAYPDQPDSVKRIAGYSGRELETVEQATEEMAQAGFLIRRHVGDLAVYALSEDREKQELVSLFLSSSEDPSLCVLMMAELLQTQEPALPTAQDQLPTVIFP